MQNSPVYIGADIAQAHIDLHGPLPNLPSRIANTSSAVTRLLKLLQARLPDAHVLCEATGGCERLLQKAAHQANISISVLNPRQVRDFARAKGQLAKTDRIDARLLSLYGSALRPRPDRPADPACEKLTVLITRRRQLVDLCTAESHRARRADSSVAASHRAVLAVLKRQISAFERSIAQFVASCPSLRHKVATLCSVSGVGTLSACALLAALPELGSLSKNQAAALAGLAPFNRDSGSFRGHRHIAGGRLPARAALYMAALVASRHNPIIKAFYLRLRSNGKPPKLALTASMRKLLIHLNSLLKSSPLPTS